MTARFFATRLTALAVLVSISFGLSQAAFAEAPHVEVHQPALNLAGAIRGVHYASITHEKPISTATLWGRDGAPKGSHVKQGESGDCYLDATMAVYAQFHPKVIEKIFLTKSGDIRTRPDGTPAARYFVKKHGTGEYAEAKPAGYNGDAPVRKDGKPVFTKVVRGATWMPMVESTYTVHRERQASGGDVRGWARTGNGGDASHVMQAATGKDAELFYFKASDGDATWAKLKKAQDENKVVVVGSTNTEGLAERTKEQVDSGKRKANAPAPDGFDEKTWVSGHAHSLWGDKDHPFLVEKDGERYIKLRNPWGSDAPGGKVLREEGSDAGVGLIRFDDFMLHFRRGFIGAPSATE